MERDIVHKAISNREVLLHEGSGAWEELTNRYPYFAAAHLLLLKSWQKEGDHRFTDQLHQAAIHTADRRALYHFVKSDADVAIPPVNTELVVTAPVVNVTSVLPQVESEPIAPSNTPADDAIGASNLASLILREDSPITDITQVTVPASIQPEAEKTAAVVPQDVVTESVSIATSEVSPEHEETFVAEEDAIEAASEEKPIIHAAELDPFERNLLVEAVRSSIEAEVSEKEVASIEEGELSGEAEEIMPDEEDQSYAAYIMRRSRQLHFGEGREKSASQEELPAGDINDWLRKAPVQDADDVSDELNIDDLPERTGLSHGAKKITVKDQKTHQKDLIDRFIRLEPQISRGKSTEFTPGNIAKESLEEDFSLVTETMAKLFVAQGKLDKARKAFRKLMELYPEKSVYFAAQLKNLDKTKK